ncbi:MAG TPA: polysaccharide deacetylase family protein, partial [Thermoanaerobaculia bacterium]|nr:polysaccharide deacetylase family protein [Thermoanaerobaculia bacterium]
MRQRLLFLFLLLSLAATGLAEPPGRTIAITFDDLPAGSVLRPDADGMRQILLPIVEACTARSIPAIGFVNENKLEVDGKVEPARRELLAEWLEAGLALGNHSYSHPDLHHTPTADYLEDVARGEVETRALLAARGEELAWFRHPFLHTGRSLEAKRAVLRFLAERGVAEAPVTVDNDDYLFAAAWDRAAERGDEAMQQR